MSKVSTKQRVEQLKDWFSWLGAVSRRNGNTPKKVKEKVAYEGKKEYFKRKS
jgi:hypothetical protein